MHILKYLFILLVYFWNGKA